MSTFHFKQFAIQQENSAMKVGIDSIVLGSWVLLSNEESMLDIGAGTGLLALMLAQRSDVLTIDAVELNSLAFEEAVTNFENSPWADRLYCYHTPVQEFTEEIEETYDLIISNPPYFTPSKFVGTNKERNQARQTLNLNHQDLLEATSSLLSENGTAAFVIPYEKESTFISLAKEEGLFPCRILHTRDKNKAHIKRSFIQVSRHKTLCKMDAMALKNNDNSYSQAFIELTKEFYKNF